MDVCLRLRPALCTLAHEGSHALAAAPLLHEQHDQSLSSLAQLNFKISGMVLDVSWGVQQRKGKDLHAKMHVSAHIQSYNEHRAQSVFWELWSPML